MGLSGPKLRAARERAGLTQGELAKKVGTSRTLVNGYENGHRQASLGRLIHLASVLGVRTDDLLDTEGAA